MELILAVVSIPLMLGLHWLFTLRRNRAELAVAQARCAQSLQELRRAADASERLYLVEVLRATQLPLLSAESTAKIAELGTTPPSDHDIAQHQAIPANILAEACGAWEEWMTGATVLLDQLGGLIDFAGATEKAAAAVVALLQRLDHSVSQRVELGHA